MFNSLSEIPLKTPLFETKVLTNLAPLAELSLLAMALFYLDRKRRELLGIYLEAVRDAKLDESAPAVTCRVNQFNAQVRGRLGAAPLWLVPFPVASRLHDGLRVDDALGQDARGPLAWLQAGIATTALVAYSAYLFATAVSLDIAAIFKRYEQQSMRGADIDLAFLVATALAGSVLYITISTMLPWTPPRLRSDDALVSGARRRFITLFPPLVLLSVPALAVINGRQGAVRRHVPHWRPMRWLANKLLPSRPRLRQRERWESRWHAVPGLAATLGTAVFFERRGKDASAKCGRGQRARYLFGDGLRPGGPQLFGTPWTAKKFNVLTKVPIDLLTGKEAKSCTPEVKANDKPPRGLSRSLGKQRAGMYVPKQVDGSLYRISLSEASLSIEAGALDRLGKGDIDGALQLLQHGISLFMRRWNPLGLKRSLRLWDLAAGIAVTTENRQVLAQLSELLEVSLKNLGEHLAPQPGAVMGVPVGSRPPQAGGLPIQKYDAQDRRRRKKSKPGDDLQFLRQQIAQRLKSWSSPNSRWRKKWRDARHVWKMGLADPHDRNQTSKSTRIGRYAMPMSTLK